MITDDELRQIMPNLPADKRAEYLPHLQAAMNEFQINTFLREAAFLAQLAHESMELKAWSENLNYSAQGLLKVFPKYFPTSALANAYARQPQKIASRVYANRMGNGDEASGEGWKYRGRGPIQLTGKDNYRNFGSTLGLDLVGNPDSVATPQVGFRVAGAFWVSRGLNDLADRQDFVTITRRINGGTHGLDDRLKYYNRAKSVLSRDDAGTMRAVPGGAPRAGARVAPMRAAGVDEEATRVPPGLSRGILPGARETIEEFGGSHDPVRGERAATKGAAKKGGAKKSATKKGAARGGAKKGAAKSAKAVGKKAAAKKRGAKKSATRKGGAKKGAARKGGAKKSGAKKPAAKKGGARKGSRR